MGQEGQSDKVRLNLDFKQFYQTESRRFVLWLPVCIGFGIWVYFALPREPDPWLCAWLLVPGMLILTGVARRGGWGMLALTWLVFCTVLGFALAVLSAHRADGPRILFPMGETVEGRVIQVSRAASGAPRVLLDRVLIYGVEPGRTPPRVRLTILDDGPQPMVTPGVRVRVYASLMPTGEPVEPGAFDFRRRAFFEGLGGVGLTRGVISVLPMDQTTGWGDHMRLWLAQVRAAVSDHLRAVLPGRQGAFAAAIIVGDRAEIDEADAEALRASNLAHLLAISGLHMGILTGMIFSLTRIGLALVPGISLRLPSKKLAAITALGVGACYLALSGGTIATQRAFIMVAVAFMAILFDRPAISLRALALAAAIVLAIRPISLLDPGFQMSFAATAALVAGYEAVRQYRGRRPPPVRVRYSWPTRLGRTLAFYVAALLFTSLLAGLATAPIAAYHFNRTAPYGLLANLLAVPVMGLWIAPFACLGAALAPFGLSSIAFQAMGLGIEHVLWVAHWVGGMPGAVQPVRAGEPIVLAVIMLGGLWLAIWRGGMRLLGVAAIAIGLWLWQTAPPRPALLVAPDARLIGFMGPEGRDLDHHKTQSFAARNWLRRDGDGADQVEAERRPGLTRSGRDLTAMFENGWRLEVRPATKVDAVQLQALCQHRVLLIARHGPEITGPCRYFGKMALRQSGALAVHVAGAALDIRAARDPAVDRLWTRR